MQNQIIFIFVLSYSKFNRYQCHIKLHQNIDKLKSTDWNHFYPNYTRPFMSNWGQFCGQQWRWTAAAQPPWTVRFWCSISTIKFHESFKIYFALVSYIYLEICLKNFVNVELAKQLGDVVLHTKLFSKLLMIQVIVYQSLKHGTIKIFIPLKLIT